jgi:hypothetical protein
MELERFNIYDDELYFIGNTLVEYIALYHPDDSEAFFTGLLKKYDYTIDVQDVFGHIYRSVNGKDEDKSGPLFAPTHQTGIATIAVCYLYINTLPTSSSTREYKEIAGYFDEEHEAAVIKHLVEYPFYVNEGKDFEPFHPDWLKMAMSTRLDDTQVLFISDTDLEQLRNLEKYNKPK